MLTIDEEPIETQKPKDLNNLRCRILYNDPGRYSPFLKLLFHEVFFHEILLVKTFKNNPPIRISGLLL
jgi:hypothetical protein